MAGEGGGSLNKYLQYSYNERIFQMVHLEMLIVFIQTEGPSDGLPDIPFASCSSCDKVITNYCTTPGVPVPTPTWWGL